MANRSANPASGTKEFVADTLALVIFFTTTGIVNERFIVGMAWPEVITARLIGAPLMILTARPYGMWRAFAMRRATGSPWSRIFWDSAALLSFQVPIYAGIIAASGADKDGLIRGIFGAAGMMIALGRPYGLFLDLVRAQFGLPPGGKKPMSPNP